MSSPKVEPTVSLSELGMEGMSELELRAWSGLAGIEIRRDYLDRPSVSLVVAYEIAEKRRAAEREWAASEARRLAEHGAAVADLWARCNSVFVATRTALLAENVGNRLFGGATERDGLATNSGLEAARQIWAAAPAAIRDEVTSVEFEENGLHNVVPLNLSLPLAIISDYAHGAARRY